MTKTYISENSLAIILLVVLILSSAFIYIDSVQPYNYKGHFSILNMDTFLYTQYARTISDGHPYQFNAADPPTTASTSHLYIWLLAFFHHIGFDELSLIDVMLVLNILFLIGSVICFWNIIKYIDFSLRWPATLMVVCSGQLMLVFLGLSDMGLFVFLLFALWLASLHKKRFLQGILLFLVSLMRPEGMVIAVLYGVVLFCEKLFYKNKAIQQKQKWLVFASGLFGVILTLLVNYQLTGMFKFDSTIGKGHFFSNSSITAFMLISSDIITLIKEIFFNLSKNFRQFYYIAIVSGLIIIWGLLQRPWGKRLFKDSEQIETWWLLGIIMQFGVVALSGWQAVHIDRYFTWVFPIFYIYLFKGIKALPLQKNTQFVLFGLLICFQLVGYPFFLHSFKKSCALTETKLRGIDKSIATMPETASVGLFGGSGIKYLAKDKYIVNFGGITVPYFRGMYSTVSRLEVIQHDTNLQFDFFLSTDSTHVFPKALVKEPKKVKVPSIFNNELFIFPMMWKPLKGTDTPFTIALDSLVCLDKLDVGYLKDENRCRYKIDPLYDVSKTLPFAITFHIDSLKYVDSARPAIGSDYFTFKTEPGKTHWLVTRFVKSDTVQYRAFGKNYTIGTDTRSVSELLLKSNNGFKAVLNIDPENNPNEKIVEFVFQLPPRAIKGNKTRFALHGDHLPSYYWIYSK